MALVRLAWRQVLRHPLRSLLTFLSVAVALFLLMVLRTLVTTLEQGTANLSSDRLYVSSSVSLYVDLPLSYEPRIASVAGIQRTCKFQWFGGYYQDPSNFFAQFAVEPERLLEMYPEIEVVAGSAEDFVENRTACMVGKGLADKFGWQVGDRIPLIGALFPHPDGPDVAWEFDLAAIYAPTIPNFDKRTFYFHWDLFEESLEDTDTGISGVGVFLVQIDEGAQPSQVIAAIDSQFTNGPQRTLTTTESEFQSQFISMFGDVPLFLSVIGTGVFVAILLACVNTMLMAAREQIRDLGILKALGFSDSGAAGVLGMQSLLLCLLGGALAVAVTLTLGPWIREVTDAMFPGYRVLPSTLALGAGLALAVGLFAGIAPVWRARRMRPVEAFTDQE